MEETALNPLRFMRPRVSSLPANARRRAPSMAYVASWRQWLVVQETAPNTFLSSVFETEEAAQAFLLKLSQRE